MNNNEIKRDTQHPSISVIIAVYKAEDYLDRCMETILGQTFTDFEVLLVDDGSPDRSGEICDRYAAADPRVRVFHKENGGVSSARQCGIENARGDYSIHIDPDDWIETDTLELLYNKAMESDADIAAGDMVREYNNRAQLLMTDVSKAAALGSIGIGNYFEVVDDICANLANKLVRNSLYREKGIRFPDGLNACEDTYVLIKLFSAGATFAFVPKVLYHYDNHSNSNSLTGYARPDRSFFTNKMEYISLLGKEGINDIYRVELARFAHSIFYYDILSQAEYSKIFFRHLPAILRSNVPVHKKLNVFLAVAGLKNPTRRAYRALKKRMLGENRM